jgi:hypothetical protein
LIHPEPHPLAGKTVMVQLAKDAPHFRTGEQYTVEDYWDRVTGSSWLTANGNPAAMHYAMRSGLGQLPMDDEVVYGKDGRGLGHLVHVSELPCPCCMGDPATVCDACGEHCCWAGIQMCEDAATAGTR